MKTFISFLRGINVSGKNRISMQNLKRLYESQSLGNVSTYIQSGNVVFESIEENPSILGKKIEAGIKNSLGMDVRVIVRDQGELKGILDANPFIIDRNEDTEMLYVTFLFDMPGDLAVSKLAGTVLRYMSPAADGGESPQGLDSDNRLVPSKDSWGRTVRWDHNWHGINDKDEFIICGKEIYLFCPNGFGRAKFSNTFFERKLGLTATTRNWKTVMALCEMAMKRRT